LQVNAGDAINLLNNKVNVVYDDVSIKKNIDNELYVVFPTINTNAPVITGSIIMWATLTIPVGYLECNGQSTAAYPDLAAVVGPNVPDLRGEFVRAWDHSRGVDSGRNLLSSQDDAFQGHHHSASTAVTAVANAGAVSAGGSLQFRSDYVKGAKSDGTNGTPRIASETRPRNVALMYLIKT
jgi:phage-related tail fiber protein